MKKAFAIMNAASAAGSARPARSRRFLWRRKLTQIGEAELLESICAAHVDHNNCGACGEAAPLCDSFRGQEKDILYPEIDWHTAVWAAARVNWACPTAPRSMARLHANPVYKNRRKRTSAPKRRFGKRSRPMMNFLFERKKSTAVID